MSKDSAEKKIAVLVKIRENKKILFGAFSDVLTKEIKSKKWKEIFSLGQSLNIIPKNKEWTYMRDVFWQNCRKSAVAKLDNSKKTGAAGGRECKLNACDNIVIDIVGRESEAIIGLGVEESLNTVNVLPSSSSVALSGTANNTSVANPLSTRKITGRKRRTCCESPLSLKKKKLMVEHIQLLNYKTKLQIAVLEKQLGYAPSNFTRSLSDGVVFAGNNSDEFPNEEESNDENNSSELIINMSSF